MTNSRKRVLVISDDERLARAIELNLHGQLDLRVVRASAVKKAGGRRLVHSHFDLIVLAASSPASEPVVALARAALANRIGRVPLLIVSDRPFESDPEARILHLDFPFSAGRLCDKVAEILR